MTLPTGEIIDRLEQGMEDMSKVEQIWNEKVVPIANIITNNPWLLFGIPLFILVVRLIYKLIRKFI